MNLDILHTAALLVGIGLVMVLCVLFVGKAKQRKIPLFCGKGDFAVSSLTMIGIVLLQFAGGREGKLWYTCVGIVLVICLVCLFKLLVTPFKNNKTVSGALCSLLGRIVVASLSVFAVVGILVIGVFLYSKFVSSLNLGVSWKGCVLCLIPIGLTGSCIDYYGAMNANPRNVEGSVYARHKDIICLGYAVISDMILLMALSKL